MNRTLSSIAGILMMLASAALAGPPPDGAAPAWQLDWDTGMAAARTAGKPVLVDFYTTTCPSCVWMDENVFSTPEIKNRFAQDWVIIKVNLYDERKATIDGNVLTYGKLRTHFRISGVPTLLFFDRAGNPVQRIVGGQKKETFALILDYMRDEAYAKNITFKDYTAKSGAK